MHLAYGNPSTAFSPNIESAVNAKPGGGAVITIVFVFCKVCEKDSEAFACLVAFLKRCGRFGIPATSSWMAPAARVTAISSNDTHAQAKGAVVDMLTVLKNKNTHLFMSIKKSAAAQQVCQEWFLSFFASFFSPSSLIPIWDRFLIASPEHFGYVALAVIELKREDLGVSGDGVGEIPGELRDIAAMDVSRIMKRTVELCHVGMEAFESPALSQRMGHVNHDMDRDLDVSNSGDLFMLSSSVVEEAYEGGGINNQVPEDSWDVADIAEVAEVDGCDVEVEEEGTGVANWPERRLGDRGKVVQVVQYLLRHHLKSRLSVDGRYSEATERSMKRFKKEHGLTELRGDPNAVEDASTWEDLSHISTETRQSPTQFLRLMLSYFRPCVPPLNLVTKGTTFSRFKSLYPSYHLSSPMEFSGKTLRGSSLASASGIRTRSQLLMAVALQLRIGGL